MACEIVNLSSIQNLKQIRSLLFPQWKSKEVKSGDWQKLDWSWKEETKSEEAKDEEFWLQKCLVAISPAGDVLVFANEDTAVFLTIKWEGNSEDGANNKFIVSGTESLPASEDFDGITCLLCLPLASQKKSLCGRPDWTAVILGTRLGYIKVYTENGILLLSQKFHEEPVTNIKCRTFDPHLHAALAEQQEELMILYKMAVVTIDGFSLYQTLRACRNQVAKATASGGESIAPPQIAYKKWGFQDQDFIQDCESMGLIGINLFDYLTNVSVRRGFSGIPRNSGPLTNLFLTTGQSPYISFYYGFEGSAPFLMRDVAMFAASKLKSVLTNFLGFSKAQSEKPANKIENPTPLPSEFELKDALRVGEKIFVSPNRRVSIVADGFGRVTLLDNFEGIALRVWKGYRDAQCGWIEVREEISELDESCDRSFSSLKIANFMLIYAPRRGILEVWLIQQGPRITAFNVGKQSRLIYCSHGILGHTSVKTAQDGKLQTRRCYIIDPDGSIYSISIPFHYALSGKDGKKVRDLYLLNKLKSLLASPNEDQVELNSEVADIVLEIKSTKIISQALDVLLSTKYLKSSLLKLIVTKLRDSFDAQGADRLDLEGQLFRFSCIRILQLLDFYDEIVRIGENNYDDEDEVGEEKPTTSLSRILKISEAEFNLILDRINKYYSICSSIKSVTFQSFEMMEAGCFLSCFQTYCSELPQKNMDDVKYPLSIALNSTVTDIQLDNLACTVFENLLRANIKSELVQDLLTNCGIGFAVYMKLLLKCWLQTKQHFGNATSLNYLKNFYCNLLFICSFKDDLEDLIDEYGGTLLWKTVSWTLSSSENIMAAYIGALTCRGIDIYLAKASKNAEKVEKQQQEKLSGDAENNESSVARFSLDSSEWEKVNVDIETWNFRIKQLEDAIILNSLLLFKIHPLLIFDLPYYSNEWYQPLRLSLIFEMGKGGISELFAKWCTCLTFEALVHLEILKSGDQSLDYFFFCEEEVLNIKKIENEECQKNFSELKICIAKAKECFPFSLNSDVLAANCCWEFASLWNKNKECSHYLINAMKCYRQVALSDYGTGLGMMLWCTFFRNHFYSAANLIEKVGKTPKDRLCRKEVGISESSLKGFIGCALDLLDSILRECCVRPAVTVSPFASEGYWDADYLKASLVDMIAKQKEPNSELLCDYYKLILTIHMVFTFGLKSVKPLALHNFENASFILKDLDASNSPYTTRTSLKDRQTQFLFRVITSAAYSISLPNFDSQVVSGQSRFELLEIVRCGQWLEKVKVLVNVWDLHWQRCLMHYVSELFSSGLDSLARDNLRNVDDLEEMSSQLILIAGQRIYNAIKVSDGNYTQLMVYFLPSVTDWFRDLNVNLRCPHPPLELTKHILVYILNAVPPRSYVGKLASQLADQLPHVIKQIKNIPPAFVN